MRSGVHLYRLCRHGAFVCTFVTTWCDSTRFLDSPYLVDPKRDQRGHPGVRCRSCAGLSGRRREPRSLYTMTVWNGPISRTCAALVTVTQPTTYTYNTVTPTYAAPVVISAPTTYVNTVPTYIPVNQTVYSPGTTYSYTPNNYTAPTTGVQPYIQIDTYSDPVTGQTSQENYGCVADTSTGVALCPPTPIATYNSSSDITPPVDVGAQLYGSVGGEPVTQPVNSYTPDSYSQPTDNSTTVDQSYQQSYTPPADTTYQDQGTGFVRSDEDGITPPSEDESE